MRVVIACIIIIMTATTAFAHGLNDYKVGERRQFLWEMDALEKSCSRESRVVHGRLHRETIGWDEEKKEFFILDAHAEEGKGEWMLDRYYFGTHPLRKVVLTIQEPDEAARKQGERPWASIYMEFTRKAVTMESLPIDAGQREDRNTPASSMKKVDAIHLNVCSVDSARHLVAAFEALCWWTKFSEVTKEFGPDEAP